MSEGETSFRDAGKQPRRGAALTAMAIALALLSGCMGPTHDPSTLKAIKAESQRLIASHPITPPKGWAVVPRSEWPPVIASLRPYFVSVHPWGVDIMIKAEFDDNWGYEIPRNGQKPQFSGECYSEPGEGVFWHYPC